MTADEEDRAGLADKETAMRFYMAGNIFDVLAQFGDLEPEILEKKKYAKYKVRLGPASISDVSFRATH
jgi:vacuolar protein sorting-associated protein VTA1